MYNGQTCGDEFGCPIWFVRVISVGQITFSKLLILDRKSVSVEINTK